MITSGYLDSVSELDKAHQVRATPVSGFAIGIIAVNMDYPKIPGNVANATTFKFPVIYETVDFEIEQLFEGDPKIENQIVVAAQKLEKQGVRAIVGACGYFGHFQQSVAESVEVPVFMSSICQVPLIKLGLKKQKKILTLVASGKDINEDFFQCSGAKLSDTVICEIGSLESFAPIRWGKTVLDNGQLKSDLVEVVIRETQQDKNIGAILLECSDLPPYAHAIQQATGLAIFDFNSLINWVYSSVVQKNYYGYI